MKFIIIYSSTTFLYFTLVTFLLQRFSPKKVFVRAFVFYSLSAVFLKLTTLSVGNIFNADPSGGLVIMFFLISLLIGLTAHVIVLGILLSKKKIDKELLIFTASITLLVFFFLFIPVF